MSTGLIFRMMKTVVHTRLDKSKNKKKKKVFVFVKA